MPLFQSNLRKQIRNLPKILNFVKTIHYFSKLFTSLLRQHLAAPVRPRNRQADGLVHDLFEEQVRVDRARVEGGPRHQSGRAAVEGGLHGAGHELFPVHGRR